LRFHKTDQNGDQSAQLATMTVGDTIEGAGVRWSISAIVDNGTWIDFTVAPQQQGTPDGIQDFVFETVTATPITVVADADYYVPFPGVEPFYSVDGAARILTQDAYNVDILVQAVAISPDWDIAATSSGGGTGGGGGGAETFTQLSDTPQSYAGHGGKVTGVKQDETGLEFIQPDGSDTFVQKAGDTMTGPLTVDANVTAPDFYAVQDDANKNEAGIIFSNENGNQGYWFWDKAGARMRLNTYIDGVFQKNKIDIPTVSGEWIHFNENVRVNNNTFTINAPSGDNTHLYFARDEVNHALIFQPETGASVGQLQINQYNAVGGFLSAAFIENTATAGSRFRSGDMYAESGLYYGSFGGNRAALIQNNNSSLGFVPFDMHYLGFVVTNHGGTNVSIQGANAANAILGTAFCDWWSDASLKTNIGDAEPVLGKLAQLDVRSFDWTEQVSGLLGRNNLPRVDAGFIADQFETVFPDMVSEQPMNGPGVREDQKPDDFEPDMKKIINSKSLIPHLVKAIQELTKRVEELENA
jgi:hypothetical protein